MQADEQFDAYRADERSAADACREIFRRNLRASSGDVPSRRRSGGCWRVLGLPPISRGTNDDSNGMPSTSSRSAKSSVGARLSTRQSCGRQLTADEVIDYALGNR